LEQPGTLTPERGGGRGLDALVAVADRLGPLLGLVVVTTFFALTAKTFLTWPNGLNIGVQTAVFAILAVGETFVLISAGVDLSVGATAALSGVVAATMLATGSDPAAAALAALAAAAGIGLLNGLVSAYGRIAPFIVTLGTMLIGRGLALHISGDRNVNYTCESFKTWFGGAFLNVTDTSTPVPTEVPLIRVPIIIMVAAAAIGHIVLTRTRLGRYTFAIGSNAEAARLSGVDVRKYQTAIFVLSGLLAGLAGLVLSTRISGGSPTTADGYELSAIAAAVIGGTSLMGGQGSIGGTVIGALLIGVVANGLDMRGALPYWQKIATGSIIVLAVFLDRLRRQRRG